MRQQGIIISDVELLSFINSILVWGVPGEGLIHVAVTDNMNAMSWMNKKLAQRGISSMLLETFSARAIRCRLKIVMAYSRTYREVTADALTRNMVGQIEELASEQGRTRVETPDIWAGFCAFANPDNLSQDRAPICVNPRSDLCLHAVEWGPGSYLMS